MKSKNQIVKGILTLAEELQLVIDALVERGHDEEEYVPRANLEIALQHVMAAAKELLLL